MDRGHQGAGDDRPEQADHGRFGPVADREPAERARQHHAFDAEVEDPGALGQDFAECGVEDRRPAPHRGGQHRGEEADGEDVAHTSTPAG